MYPVRTSGVPVSVSWRPGGSPRSHYDTLAQSEDEYIDIDPDDEQSTLQHALSVALRPPVRPQPASITIWVNGKKHGVTKRFTKGVCRVFAIPFVDGRKHGVEKKYDANGKLQSETTWVRGKRVR